MQSDYREIPLTHGFIALVDAEDSDKALSLKWHIQQRRPGSPIYARGCLNTGVRIFLHRFILDAPKGLQIDHINGNGLDNRRHNLRICSQSQNQANVSLRKDTRTGFKGVRRDTKYQKWIARITFQGQRHNLGSFDDAISAARAYDIASHKFFGEFARVNFP